MIILFSRSATNTLNRVYTDRSIFNAHGNFMPWFIRWNYIFHQYVRESTLSALTAPKGTFMIGRLGSLDYYIYSYRGIKCLVVEEFSFPTFRFTSSSIPTVDTTKSPKNIWTPPKGKSFVLPQKMTILNKTYYNGLKVGYYNRKYTILNAEGKPLTNRWFDNRPHFFKQPFGKYGIIAHVNYRGSLFAVSVNGQMRDMNKLWDDVYLKEMYDAIIKSLITETINNYLKKNLLLAS